MVVGEPQEAGSLGGQVATQEPRGIVQLEQHVFHERHTAVAEVEIHAQFDRI